MALTFEKRPGVADIINTKGQRKLTMLTAYDAPTARIAEAGGVDMILVGDSVAMTMLGRPDTNSVTLDEMIYHAALVVAVAKRSMVIGDMPFLSYEISPETALENAGRYFRESGVRAVKVEGGRIIAPQVRALTLAGIPVIGHLGLTPQRAAMLGGFKAQARTAKDAGNLLEDALALQAAGCFALVLECVPAPVAKAVTEKLTIPTIGIGAGPDCDGQVLVFHDMLGLGDFKPKFVKVYAQLGELARSAVSDYCREVQDGAFPGPEHCFAMPDDELKAFINALGAEPD